MPSLVDQAIWPDPILMISAMGLEGPDAFQRRICADLELSADEVTLINWDERAGDPDDAHFGLAVGIESQGLSLVRHFRFPTSLTRLEALVRGQAGLQRDHAVRLAASRRWPAPNDTTRRADDVAGEILSWFDDHVTTGSVSFEVTPYERESAAITSASGQGVHAFLWHRGCVGQLWAELPFPTSVVTDCLAGLLQLLVEESGQQDAAEWESPWLANGLRWLPFLHNAAQDFPTLLQAQLAACGTEREVELLARGWATTRWHASLNQLGPAGVEAFESDSDEAIEQLAQEALSVAAAVHPDLLPAWVTDETEGGEAPPIALPRSDPAPFMAAAFDPSGPGSTVPHTGALDAPLVRVPLGVRPPLAIAEPDLLQDQRAFGGSLAERPALPPLSVCAVPLLLGAMSPSYAYYSFLRVMVCATAVILVAHAVRTGRFAWCAASVLMFFLYAPAKFVLLPHNTWNVIDVMLAAVLLWAGTDIPAPRPGEVDGNHKDYKPWPWWGIPLAVYASAALLALNSMRGVSG